MAPLLRHLDLGELIGAAGGDPWQVNKTIQSGSPGEISGLASAFYDAGVCSQETSEEFYAAKQRFAAAWDRQDGGDHPINDSAEVRRATESLRLSREQLSRIAVDLQNVSAALTEAQRAGDIVISNVEIRLRMFDDYIDREIAIAAAEGRAADWSDLKQAANDATEQGLREMHAVRDAYAAQLDAAQLEMAAEGYSPDAAAAPVDGVGDVAVNPAAHAEADRYDKTQRAADEALVNAPGPWTPDKQAAAERLRDHATINDPRSGVDEVHLAGERLNGHRMAQFAGPLPADTVLGGNARTRAQARLQMQQLLETTHAIPGQTLTPDQATRLLDQWEMDGRAMVLDKLATQLTQAGVSQDGADRAIREIQNGKSPAQVLREATGALATQASALGEGAKAHSGGLPSGRHWGAAPVWSHADVEALRGFGSKLGWAGTGVDALTTIYDISNGAPVGEEVAQLGGRTAGTMLGGLVAGAAWGTFVGPHGTLVVGFLGAIAGGIGGEEAVDWMRGR